MQLFQDMSLLLDTQQELVNTIEAQVENTAVYVEEGAKQVGEAIEYRKKSRRVSRRRNIAVHLSNHVDMTRPQRWWWICACIVVAIIMWVLNGASFGLSDFMHFLQHCSCGLLPSYQEIGFRANYSFVFFNTPLHVERQHDSVHLMLSSAFRSFGNWLK